MLQPQTDFWSIEWASWSHHIPQGGNEESSLDVLAGYSECWEEPGGALMFKMSEEGKLAKANEKAYGESQKEIQKRGKWTEAQERHIS